MFLNLWRGCLLLVALAEPGFPSPTCWLTIVSNSSFMGYEAHPLLLDTSYTYGTSTNFQANA